MEERQRAEEAEFRELVSNFRKQVKLFKTSAESLGPINEETTRRGREFGSMVGDFMDRTKRFQGALSELDDETEDRQFIDFSRGFLRDHVSALQRFQKQADEFHASPLQPAGNPVNPLEILPRLKDIFFEETLRFSKMVSDFGNALEQADLAGMPLDKHETLLKSYEDLLKSLEDLIKSFKDIHTLNRTIVLEPIKEREDLLKSQEDLIKSYLELAELFKKSKGDPMKTKEDFLKSLQELLKSVEDLLKSADDLQKKPLVDTEALLKSVEDLIKSLNELEKAGTDRQLQPLRDREALLKSLEDLLKSARELAVG